MFKIVISGVFLLSSVFSFLYSKVESHSKLPYQGWTCSDCEEENPFWYSLCGGCGRFYW